MKFGIFAVILLAQTVLGESLGLDIPTPLVLTPTEASCLVSAGYDMIFIRAYRSIGKVDPNVLKNLKNARNAGFKNLNVYIFPCVPHGDPRKQVQDTVSHLKGEKYERIWLDVEEFAWSKNFTYNKWFISEMINELTKLGQPQGVYANWYQWGKIVGREWDGASAHQLWYPHWDHKKTFDDFRPFGGWKKPQVKQYDSKGSICGLTGLDLDWKP